VFPLGREVTFLLVLIWWIMALFLGNVSRGVAVGANPDIFCVYYSVAGGMHSSSLPSFRLMVVCAAISAPP